MNLHLKDRISLVLLSLASTVGIFSVTSVFNYQKVSAHCTGYHPHHCSIDDIKDLPNQIPSEIDNCINGGGCSIPADEAWGEAGRVAYTSGQQTIAAKNSRLPAKGLTSWQKDHLRPYFGSLVDRVRIKYGATTLDNWRIGNWTINVPSDGQAFCNDIYITQRYRSNNRSLLGLIAHEMVHSQQCKRLGGASNFGYKYFKEYKRANQNYRNNQLEREAYDFEAKFDREYASREERIRTAKRHVNWSTNLGDRIQSHREMPEGSFLQSGDGRFKMVVQGDGNLVVYQNNRPIWASNTSGKGSPSFKLAMQSDGNLVMYGRTGVVWASNTDRKGVSPYNLVMQNDGNLVIYDRNGTPTWATNTCCR
ncbi:MAG: hypothetical protein F6K10_20860 [Moorea sp. SIO2B7]|nr:hypothetical protein [Moorena sp. SIO2B7]